jgi:hypothetical protein
MSYSSNQNTGDKSDENNKSVVNTDVEASNNKE